MTPELRRAQANIRTWRENPVRFVWDNFKVEPDSWQREALEVFPSQEPNKIRVSLQACVGPGKTAVLSWMGWNFLSCYADIGEHPKGAAVSITATNLADNLWPEFSKWQSRSPYLERAFQWTKTRIFAKDHPETWFMSARSFSKTANPEEQGRTLSGLHGKFVLVLIDESGDIPPPVARAAEQIASGNPRFVKIIQAGNPTSHDGILYAAATSLRHLWHVIRITGDPEDPRRSPRIDMAWAREQIKTYGRDNPWIMSSVLGLFPPSSINSLLGPDEVASAMGRHLTSDQYEYAQKRLGIDVARFGDDSSVIFPRQGLAAFSPIQLRGARTNDIAARVMSKKAEWGSEIEMIDDTGGYGAGVIDYCLQAGVSLMAINASGRASDPRFFNLRAECHWNLAQWVKRGGALPKDDILARELVSPTYTFRDGKILIEPKDLVKKRLGASPDKADALSQSFALPEMPASLALPVGSARGGLQSDWDPYRD